MRIFQNVDKKQQVSLVNMFPNAYKLVFRDDSSKYKFMAISVFDHWLSAEESYELLSEVSKKEQLSRDKKFNLFANKLIGNTEVINLAFEGVENRSVFQNFVSDTDKAEYMKSGRNFSRQSFFKVALPELEALYIENYDDTNIFYLRNESHASLIESWATECGLYRLD